MRKKTILVLGPVSPQANEIQSIAKTLTFLEDDYHIDYLDSLMLTDNIDNHSYYRLWGKFLDERLSRYDVFFGFSFGGVILQQCFSLFESVKKQLILFSTPGFADKQLKLKLQSVIDLLQEKRLEDALISLYEHVYASETQLPSFAHLDKDQACQRLIFGLTKVLTTESTQQLKECTVDHLHLIGEHSKLVNVDNVIAPKTGQLLTVPQAGMRVLQDNPVFCQRVILERLRHAG